MYEEHLKPDKKISGVSFNKTTIQVGTKFRFKMLINMNFIRLPEEKRKFISMYTKQSNLPHSDPWDIAKQSFTFIRQVKKLKRKQ